MRAISPITNKKFIDQRAAGGGVSSHPAAGTYENDSMNFTNTTDDPELLGVTLPAYSAGVGALNDDENGVNTKGLLSSISLYHIGNYGSTITAFHMFNPRITSLQPDELSMADNGDGSEFSFEFNYDSLYVDPAIPVGEFGLENIANKSGERVGALYPLYILTADGAESGGNNKGI